MIRPALLFLLFTGLYACYPCHAQEILVTDDAGRRVRLEYPARRLVSLAPNVTENLFSAGVGDLLVGTVNYSDYPPAARSVPQVGGYNNFDIERIHSLRPDLVIAWQEGNLLHQVERLEELGYPVYISYPRKFEDIARNIRHFGIMTGHLQQAEAAAAAFLAELTELRARYSGASPVTVFYQVWARPLITVSDAQIIGRAIELCGGSNIFGKLGALTPEVDVEAVLAADPDVIIASGMDERRPDWLDDWKQWPFLRAVQDDHLYFIEPDIIQRHTTRLLLGTWRMCEYLALPRGE